jgi:hypothetical protein
MATISVTSSEVGYTPQIAVTKTCFAHHHLTVEEYGLWTHARQLAHESGILYFDGRKIAKRFIETGKNTIYRIGHNLIRKGWLVIVREPKRLKNGMFSPGQYRPVSHDEWVAKHPGACPGIGTGEDDTSPEIGNDLSRNQERPVLESGHNIKGLNLKGECKGDEPESTSSRVQGLDTPHTPILNSNAHSADGDEKSKTEDQEQSAPHHHHRVLDLKKECAAPAPAPAPYGSPAWWDARNASMSDEEKVFLCVAGIQLNNNRTFKCNGKIKQIVRAALATGVPWRNIVAAAEHIGSALDERDRVPGLTLEHNLSATIDKLGLLKAEAAKEQAETERIKRELEALPRPSLRQSSLASPLAADHQQADEPPF